MKKRLANPANKKQNLFFFLQVPFLLFLLFLIKIGQMPSKTLSKTGKITLGFFKKGRGRPRSTPWLKFQARRILATFKHKFAKPTRLKLALASFIILFCIYSLFLAKIISQLPSPSRLMASERPLTTQILDRNGKLLYQMYEGRNRKLIELKALPSYLIQATIAAEDKYFYYHPGVDPVGIVRAVKMNLASDSNQLQGGSTITQQLVKNTLLTPDQTLTRKIKEIFLACWVERIYSKEEILQMYFNEAPYGGPAWGIEAAAEMYFGKSAKDLSLPESTFLAGLPASPTQFSPFGVHPEQGKIRQKNVLRRMVEDGYLSQKQADETFASPLAFKSPQISIKAPHFVMYVESILASKYGSRVVSQGGLKVITTLDLDIQEMAENIVASEIEKLANFKVSNGAAMVTDSKTGQILAMVGSKNYFDKNGGNFNVTLATRQPGSAIKPITYITAFKQGYTPGTILLDTPTSFPLFDGKIYSPVNYDGKFHGPVTIRTALGSSYNVPAVKMLGIVGLPAMLTTAKEMGITTLNKPEDYGLSLTLGGGGVKLIDMMSVYGTLASNGVRHEPEAILEVIDSFGNILENHQEIEGKRVITEEIAYLINNILVDNQARSPAFGVNSLLNIPNHIVAAKTGTSDDKRDNWTFGYTPDIAVGVWVGNNDNSPMDPQLTSGITGAAPIWNGIMTNLLSEKPNLAFVRPSTIIELTSGQKDLGIAGIVPKTVVGYKKVKQKDQSGQEKDIITFTDPYSIFTPDQTKTTQ
ncbi:MAG: transglycosylase domain-containing protein [Candidatus Daviesbacteria bacterium]